MEQFGLKDADLEAMRAVLAQFPSVSKAVIYGSRAKGNFRPGSDIDLVLLGEDLSLVTQYAIETAFDELLLPYKVDLSLYNHIQNSELLAHIQRVGQVFFVQN